MNLSKFRKRDDRRNALKIWSLLILKVEPVETGWDATTTAWRSSFLLPLNFFFVLVRDGGTMGLLAFFG